MLSVVRGIILIQPFPLIEGALARVGICFWMRLLLVAPIYDFNDWVVRPHMNQHHNNHKTTRLLLLLLNSHNKICLKKSSSTHSLLFARTLLVSARPELYLKFTSGKKWKELYLYFHFNFFFFKHKLKNPRGK